MPWVLPGSLHGGLKYSVTLTYIWPSGNSRAEDNFGIWMDPLCNLNSNSEEWSQKIFQATVNIRKILRETLRRAGKEINNSLPLKMFPLTCEGGFFLSPGAHSDHWWKDCVYISECGRVPFECGGLGERVLLRERTSVSAQRLRSVPSLNNVGRFITPPGPRLPCLQNECGNTPYGYEA